MLPAAGAGAGSVDTDPGLLRILKRYGAEVAKRRAAPVQVIKPLDVIEVVSTDRLRSSVEISGRALGFKESEGTFHRPVVPHLTCTAHAAAHAWGLESCLKVFTGWRTGHKPALAPLSQRSEQHVCKTTLPDNTWR